MSAAIYLQRCIQLAKYGCGMVAPNPMVGAVLVYNDTIIGEGWHQQYGGPHAEVNCFNSVPAMDRHLIPAATLYVSLEPCAHFGKTPPCADLIIRHDVKKVIIGSRDPFPEVNGKGIDKLRQAGIEVEMADASMQEQCELLNRRFFHFHTKQQPYIILKWAQSSDGRIASTGDDGKSRAVKISNELSNRLVHRWRSEEAAIMIGTGTAMTDDPSLTNRLWSGRNPTRIVFDLHNRIPPGHRIFDGPAPTIIIREGIEEQPAIDFASLRATNTKVDLGIPDGASLHEVMRKFYRYGIQSILVEGGAKLLESFIREECWNEIRTITNTTMTMGNGLVAPVLPSVKLINSFKLRNDHVNIYTHE